MSMFENFRNLAGMLGNAKEWRQKAEQFQAEMARKTVEADAGAGAVRVVINGKFEVQSIKLDRPLIQTLAGEGTEADQQVIEDLIVAAFNAAVAKMQETLREELSRMSGGMNLGGMFGA